MHNIESLKIQISDTTNKHNTPQVIHVLWENEVKEMKTKLSGEP